MTESSQKIGISYCIQLEESVACSTVFGMSYKHRNNTEHYKGWKSYPGKSQISHKAQHRRGEAVNGTRILLLLARSNLRLEVGLKGLMVSSAECREKIHP